MEEFGTDDVFEYKIRIPEMTSKIVVKKRHLMEKLGSAFTEEAWKEFKRSDEWLRTFPRYAAAIGVNYYGAEDGDLYKGFFKHGVKGAVRRSIRDDMANLFDDLFPEALSAAAAASAEAEEAAKAAAAEPDSITLENIEKQTKKRIQEDNVKNGLARCANETKEKSIEKWKAYYMQHNA
jgi:hypothetical protein